MDAADRALLDRDASVILRIPPGFGRDLARDQEADLQLVFDPANNSDHDFVVVPGIRLRLAF